MNKWKRTVDELPAEGEDVLCFFGTHTPMQVGTQVEGNWQDSTTFDSWHVDPTHWMRLPKEPQS